MDTVQMIISSCDPNIDRHYSRITWFEFLSWWIDMALEKTQFTVANRPDASRGKHSAHPDYLCSCWTFLWCSPWGCGGTVHGLVEPSSLPVSPPLRWLAADLMGLAAVEEKQWGLVAYALVRTKSSEHTTRATTAWAERSAATGAAVNH